MQSNYGGKFVPLMPRNRASRGPFGKRTSSGEAKLDNERASDFKEKLLGRASMNSLCKDSLNFDVYLVV